MHKPRRDRATAPYRPVSEMTEGTPKTHRPKLLFLITEDWYFWSHRLELARAARSAGWDVSIATRVCDHGKRIEDEGFQLFPLRLVRSSRHPFQELLSILELVRLYRRVRPEIVHHVALKPILYGSVAARLARVPATVNGFAGLGYTFIESGERKGFLRSTLGKTLGWALALTDSRVVFQNQEDAKQLVDAGIVSYDQIRVIRGVGVDTAKFSPPRTSQENPVPLVVLAGRMLWDKGIAEFVEAAQLLNVRKIRAQCVLVGMIDKENPAAISEAQLRAWQKDGVVEWWGHREDMPNILASAQIVVLPSYREGLPKVLLEAAACARSLVATDVPGCREVVKDGLNGFLVPPKDAVALSQAIARLLQDPSLRAQMGACGRQIVLKEFSVDRISGETLDLYKELVRRTLTPSPPPSYL
jgi:glycosyltransferase involved in cell wall biosynthesis